MSRARVAPGGARWSIFVQDADVGRRYARSVANEGIARGLTDITHFYDNSGDDDPRLILVAKAGQVVWGAGVVSGQGMKAILAYQCAQVDSNCEYSARRKGIQHVVCME